MSKSNGKPKKPGPKHFISDPSKWCGIIKADGAPCQGLRQNHGNTERCARHQRVTNKQEDVQALLPGVVYEIPKKQEIKTLEQVSQYIENTINDARTGQISVLLANCIWKGCGELVKVRTAIERLDPKKVLNRALSREAAIAQAKQLTPEQADEIIAERKALLLDALVDPESNIETYMYKPPEEGPSDEDETEEE
jgi:hypothetical protein